jgi:4-aminobutyrate aminotransferase
MFFPSRQPARRFVRSFSHEGKKIFHGVKRLSDVIVRSGKGSRVTTVEGKSYLDFVAGIGVLSTGHAHPTVVKAVCEQAGLISHAQQSCFYSETVNTLIRRMQAIVPSTHDAFFFANSGAEGVENAVRLARQVTGRDGIICFTGGYHGRTTGTLALTSSGAAYRGNRLGASPAGTWFAPYPYEFLGSHRSVDHIFDEMELMLKTQTNPHDTAAVLIEPVMGEGGYVPAPVEFMQRLRAFCDKHEFLLIADEVQCGYGRTGKMFAVEHSEVQPDILVAAKGIASGYPLAAVTCNKSLSDRQLPGSMGGTYGGNAVACAAAIATLDVFEQENLLANVAARGSQLQQGLNDIATRYDCIKDVRGWGLMVACEFDHTMEGFAGQVSSELLNRGMMLSPTGPRQTMRFAPPLVVTEQEIDEALDHFEQALATLTR